MIRAVLFDLGDTLLLYRGIDLPEAFKEGGKRAREYLLGKGVPVPPLGRFWRAHFYRMLMRDFYCRMMQREFCVVDVIRRYQTRQGVRLTDEEFTELARRWYAPMGEYAHLEENIHGTLEELVGMGLKLAIVSNVPVPGLLVDEQLAAHDLLRFFPARIYSSDFGERKPRRRLFTSALDAVGVPAREAVFVGDRIYSDLHGAKRLGLTGVLLPSRFTGWRPVKPDHRIARVAELPDLIRRLNGESANARQSPSA
jgi:putative hydrolase of the HAD superfamily